jgi:hypothetical protein
MGGSSTKVLVTDNYEHADTPAGIHVYISIVEYDGHDATTKTFRISTSTISQELRILAYKINKQNTIDTGLLVPFTVVDMYTWTGKKNLRKIQIHTNKKALAAARSILAHCGYSTADNYSFAVNRKNIFKTREEIESFEPMPIVSNAITHSTVSEKANVSDEMIHCILVRRNDDFILRRINQFTKNIREHHPRVIAGKIIAEMKKRD